MEDNYGYLCTETDIERSFCTLFSEHGKHLRYTRGLLSLQTLDLQPKHSAASHG
jgi:hypothetical protein